MFLEWFCSSMSFALLRRQDIPSISSNCGLKGIVQEISDEEHSGHNGY